MKRLRHWWPFLLVATGLFVTSSLPGDSLPPPDLGEDFLFGWMARNTDKVFHALVYSVLGWFSLRGFTQSGARPLTGRLAFFAVLVTAAYGASDEFHQSFVPLRTCALDDWVADTFGGLLAASVAFLLRWRARRRTAISVPP